MLDNDLSSSKYRNGLDYGLALPLRQEHYSAGALLEAAEICQEPIFRADAADTVHGFRFVC
jgi:hypothetical protein